LAARRQLGRSQRERSSLAACAVGVLMSTAADDAKGQEWSAAFAQGLQQLGWEIGGNVRYRAVS
jgi:hypothetical protein